MKSNTGLLGTQTEVVTVCYHCGDNCARDRIYFDSKDFCCEGCRLVYELLRDNDLCGYYQYNPAPGATPPTDSSGRFGYLDDPDVKSRLLRFNEGRLATVVLQIPRMHCSSCIWLLENLHRINQAVVRSRVEFLDRKVTLMFRQDQLSIRGLVELLSMIGYEPSIRLDDLEMDKAEKNDRTPIYKIGVAGFAFGNIMLFSFPEYFSISTSSESGFQGLFSFLNFSLSLPVFFYCSSQFFKSAWRSIHQRFLNIDVPIALGILVMFIRSSYDILSRSGSGYMDTMAGLVFFMLLGRHFQDKTYKRLSFDRDYKSFFPVSVMVHRDGKRESIPLSRLRVKDVMEVRNGEIIPADSLLMDEQASIDYAFVTGESLPVKKSKGELVFAGGRQKGPSVRLQVTREVAQSYLTQLWNEERYSEKRDVSGMQLLVDRISHYFTFVILAVSLFSLAFWLYMGEGIRGWDSFTTVLIIACPCALAISSPFTLGNILRIFGRSNLYLRGFSVIEGLAKVDTVVFDKTGTLTVSENKGLSYEGPALTERQIALLTAATNQSDHPLSRMLHNYLIQSDKLDRLSVQTFIEFPGNGIEAGIGNELVRIGSASFVSGDSSTLGSRETEIHFNINGSFRGKYVVSSQYREGIRSLFSDLRKSGYLIVVLTGDNDAESVRIDEFSGKSAKFLSNQRPEDKLLYIQELQSRGYSVLMVGDGLNDAGALRQADMGISVSDDINNFSPACDGILRGDSLPDLPVFLRVAKFSRKIIIGSFLIALTYNFVGCWFAVQGNLSPVIAAILMPLSTVTIISFTTGMSNWLFDSAKNSVNREVNVLVTD